MLKKQLEKGNGRQVRFISFQIGMNQLRELRLSQETVDKIGVFLEQVVRVGFLGVGTWLVSPFHLLPRFSFFSSTLDGPRRGSRLELGPG